MKPVKLRLEIDLVSYPARAVGLGIYIALGKSINPFIHPAVG